MNVIQKYTHTNPNTCKIMHAFFFLGFVLVYFDWGVLLLILLQGSFEFLYLKLCQAAPSYFKVHKIHEWSLNLNVHDLLCALSFTKGFKMIVLLSKTSNSHVDLIKNMWIIQEFFKRTPTKRHNSNAIWRKWMKSEFNMTAQNSVLSFMTQQCLGTKREDKSFFFNLEILLGTLLLAYCLLLWSPLNKTNIFFFFSYIVFCFFILLLSLLFLACIWFPFSGNILIIIKIASDNFM